MRRGVRLGVDVGDVRIGVARSDADGILAVPVETVPAGPGDHARVVALATEYDALEVVVGLPVSLRGAEGTAAGKARSFAQRLAVASPIGVRLCDERLSTVSANAGLRDAGVAGRARRTVIDQAAAVVILQNALDTERTSGRPPGELMAAPEGLRAPDGQD